MAIMTFATNLATNLHKKTKSQCPYSKKVVYFILFVSFFPFIALFYHIFTHRDAMGLFGWGEVIFVLSVSVMLVFNVY